MKKNWFLLLFISFFSLSAYAQEYVEEAKNYLQKHISDWELQPADLSDLVVTDAYQSAHNGAYHVYFRQRFQGIEILDANIQVHLLKNLRVIKVNEAAISNLQNRVPSLSPSLGAKAAIEQAAISLDIPFQAGPKQTEAATGKVQKSIFSAPEISLNPIPVKLMLFVDKNGQMSLAWNLQIYELNTLNWWDLWVDANTGKLLEKRNWVNNCDWETSESHADHDHQDLSHDLRFTTPMLPKPTGANEYNVFPVPFESPADGPRALLFDPSDSLASPFGWHDTTGTAGPEFTITRGNNVWSKLDHDATNSGGASADGGPTLDFDFPLDLNQAPITYTDAATTNLFYMNNVIHDVMYYYGFTEVAGNFQENNYDRGGVGGDYVNADAQDGAGRNNANFATPGDGVNPRMQMFLFGDYLDSFRVNTPAGISGTYISAGASFGSQTYTSITNELILAEDGTGNNRACNPLTNASALSGKIAVIDRGTCNFVAKVGNAEAAGAIAAIIINDQPGNPTNPWGNGFTITIPSIMISQDLGNQIKNELNNGQTVTGTIRREPLRNNPQAKDGDFDNGIIVHEYGHGVSNRLTGGPANSGCLSNVEQAGEGWSDFYAIAFSHQAGDQANTPRPIGSYAFGFGIRPYPYTRDMNVNPMTYNDIGSVSIPHGVGSVFCTMLWDLYWNLVDQYGFDPDLYQGTGGNNIAIQLVTDGLALQTCSPGFVDARDAIILADQINNGGANECLIWETFARRGLGYSASQGSPSNVSDGVEAYDIPPTCQKILLLEKSVDQNRAKTGDTLTYTLWIKNQTDQTLTNVLIADTLESGLTYIPGSASCGATETNGIVSLQIGSLASGGIQTCTFQAKIDPTTPFTSFIYDDDLESNQFTYGVINQVGTDGFRLDTLNPRSGQYAYFVPNAPALNDQVLMMPIQILSGNPRLSFWHAFVTENEWDGGVVEILPTVSTGVWEDAAPYMIFNPYNSKVGSNNPAGERSAFSGNSKGYIKTVLDLSSFVNEPIFIRFRFLSDDNTVEEGWWIDDISITQGADSDLGNRAFATSAEGETASDSIDQRTVVLAGNTTSIGGDPEGVSVKLFPNPANNQIALEVAGLKPGTVELELRNINGQRVLSEAFALPGTLLQKQMDLSDMAKGVYLIRMRNGEHVITRKFVKQ
jgi:extracellular elastinolytic metalloproteinase